MAVETKADPKSGKEALKKLKEHVIEDYPEEETYELMPHQEIKELKEELRKLRETPPTPGRHLEAGIAELANKIDKLNSIFEKASKELEFEEGGEVFLERMRPFIEKMNKTLEQNSEIAEGVVALADMINDIKEKLEEIGGKEAGEPIPQAPMPSGMGELGPMPGLTPGPYPGPVNPFEGPTPAHMRSAGIPPTPPPRPMPGMPPPRPGPGMPPPRPRPGMPPPPRKR